MLKEEVNLLHTQKLLLFFLNSCHVGVNVLRDMVILRAQGTFESINIFQRAAKSVQAAGFLYVPVKHEHSDLSDRDFGKRLVMNSLSNVVECFVRKVEIFSGRICA